MIRLKELRSGVGLNMREAAAALELPYTTYVNYEKGLREPGAEMLIRIARYYGVTVDYLIENTDAVQADRAPAPDAAATEAEARRDDGQETPRRLSPEELKYALWGDAEGLSDEDLADVLRYASFLAEMKKKWS